MTRRALAWTANAAASGVIGWVVLMAAMEGAWFAQCWITKRRSGQ